MHGTSDNLFLLARIHVEETMLIPVMLTGVCMAHQIACLIPTGKNTCGRNNTNYIFFIGYQFITARKVSSAISSLNVCEKTFEKSHTQNLYQ